MTVTFGHSSVAAPHGFLNAALRLRASAPVHPVFRCLCVIVLGTHMPQAQALGLLSLSLCLAKEGGMGSCGKWKATC